MRKKRNGREGGFEEPGPDLDRSITLERVEKKMENKEESRSRWKTKKRVEEDGEVAKRLPFHEIIIS